MDYSQSRPEELAWTGERYVPEIEGEIELEHLHRYAIARELAYGKDVLDIACGEGYGSELLATVARKVTGVDISEEAIVHASRKYVQPNITFAVGSCATIPLADASIDLVVSFETIEHHNQHLEMIQEIRRVLRQDGVLIISSPDKHEYSDVPGYKNEYHVKELYLSEFTDLISSEFRHVSVFGQRVYFGSLVAPIDGRATRFVSYSRRNESVRREPGVMKPVYYVALASNAVLPEIHSGLYDGTSFLGSQIGGRDGQIASLNQAVVERDGQIASLNQTVVERDGQIASLNQTVVERDGQIASLNQTVVERDGQIASLNQTVVERDGQIASLNQAVAERERQVSILNQTLADSDKNCVDILNSTTWRLTWPARLLGHQIKRAMHLWRLAPKVIAYAGGLRSACAAAIRIYRRDGLAGVRHGLKELQLAPISQGTKMGSPVPRVQNRQLDKEQVRKDAELELEQFLSSKHMLDLHHAESPHISVILVLYNQAGLTLRCLQSIASEAQPIEVIAVDNASADATPQLVERVRGLRYLRNGENVGFLKAVNQAAAMARGDYLLLLNNDAELIPGALSAALQRIERDPRIGAVGGKIILLDGKLQEAGSIIWNDGSCDGYGRGADPEAPEFHFLRDVDYCSGAFLLVRTDIFHKLGGFDQAYAPAYYEEVDFCCRLRTEGFRIVYDPKVIVRHFEFASSKREEAALAMQVRNRAIFCVRQASFLAGQPSSATRNVLVARSCTPCSMRVLIVEDQVPHPHLGSGYPRAMEIVREIDASGRFVTLYPLNFPRDDWGQVYRTLPETVEVMLGWGAPRLREFLNNRSGYYDAVLVCRPHNMAVVAKLMGEMPELLSGVPIIYDAEALYAPRQIQAAVIKGRPYLERDAQRMLDQELALAATADRVLAVSVAEAAQFSAGGCSDVRVLGHSLNACPTESAFAKRSGFLFVGRLREDDSPNVDSVVWFIENVWPRIVSALGHDAHLTLVGDIASKRVLRLSSPSVRSVGKVETLSPYFEAARVFIVPTRYAAGIPLKALESAARGLPIVATPIIARQLGWRDEEDLLVAEGAEAFSKACVRLHSAEVLWGSLRSSALARIAVECSPGAFRGALLEALNFPAATMSSPVTLGESRCLTSVGPPGLRAH